MTNEQTDKASDGETGIEVRKSSDFRLTGRMREDKE